MIASLRTNTARQSERLLALRANAEVRGSTATHLVSGEREPGKNPSQPSDVVIQRLCGGLEGVVKRDRRNVESPGAKSGN